MNKYTVGLFLSLALLATPVTAQAITNKTGLSADQVTTIIQLLQSFNVDASIIEKVKMSLGAVSTTEKKFCHTFNKDLTVGSKGDEVVALVQVLKASGIETTGKSSEFTENNAGDVVAFQAKHGIRQTGYVGPLTRGKLNTLYRCQNDQKPTESIRSNCPDIALPACIGKPIMGPDGCTTGWQCKTGEVPNMPVPPISEQVKCVFNGAATEQKCWGDVASLSTMGETKPAHYGCSGVGTCVVSVTAPKGTPSIVWGSSCGGSVETKVDGNTDYAYFNCGTSNTGY